jgi:hypothetical protein
MTKETEFSISSYIQALQKELATGNTTEHTHRLALKTLVESNVPGVIATNEPGRIKCGAPDFAVSTSNPLLSGTSISDSLILIGVGFSNNVSYPLTITGTLQNGVTFSYTKQVKIVEPTN